VGTHFKKLLIEVRISRTLDVAHVLNASLMPDGDQARWIQKQIDRARSLSGTSCRKPRKFVTPLFWRRPHSKL
jgi:hypothetical protein